MVYTNKSDVDMYVDIINNKQQCLEEEKKF